MNVRNFTNNLSQWLHNRQNRALAEAYAGAQRIAELEAQCFGGGKIAYTPNQSKTVYEYVRSLRDRQLLRIRFNLVQLGVNNFLFARQSSVDEANRLEDSAQGNNEVIQKLNFIESVVAKYRDDVDAALLTGENKLNTGSEQLQENREELNQENVARTIDPAIIEVNSQQNQSKQSGSFLDKLRPFRNKNEEAEYERQMIVNLRLRRQQTRIALRWLLIILIIPLVIQILAKNLIFEPLLGNYSNRNPIRIELSQEVRDRFAQKFNLVKERLEVESLLGITPKLTEEAKKAKLQEAAIDIWRESRNEQLNGLKNLLADGVTLTVFAVMAYLGRRKIAIFSSTANRTFLTLTDSVKVFLFILVTDVFVGFHSAEGWEVILESISEYFRIPANKAFVNGFIATVPVIIDSCLKF